MPRSLPKLLLLILLLFTVSCSSQNDIDTVIVDEAFVFDKNSKLMQDYLAYNNYLLHDFNIDFRVITTNSLEEINLFTNQHFNAINSRSTQGRTILLVLNIGQDKARVEVSTELEHIFTDSFVSYVERKGMLPYFQDNKLDEGIFMLSELIKDTAMDKALKTDTDQEIKSQSIGAGAQTQAKIAQANPKAKEGKNITSNKNDTPDDVLKKYFASLKAHNKNPNLDIYTTKTKAFFRSWTTTDINQDNELRFSKNCTNGKYYYTDTHAVYYQPVNQRTCVPYFFEKEDGRWKLDIYMMSKVIRFNTKMQWHFDMQAKQEYFDAYNIFFQHLGYDKNGFPYVKKRKWGFTCDEWYDTTQPEKMRCFISELNHNGKAKNDLGMKVGDKIIRLGQQGQHLDDPTLNQTMAYMKSIQQGQRVYLGVLRNEKFLLLSTEF